MKITSVEIYQVKVKNPPVPGWIPVCVKVNTDEGISGWGESGIPVNAGRAATAMMIKEIAPLIIGLDPLEHDVIWERMFHLSYWSYAGGAVEFAAISALDVAIWDIKGKYCNLPVYKLLGGKANEKLRTYASQIQLGWGPIDHPVVSPEDYAEQALRAVKQGYKCVKVDPLWTDDIGKSTSPQKMNFPKDQVSDWEWKGLNNGKQLETVSNRVGAIRDAVGKEVDIIIELHGMTDVNTAIQIGRELDQYKCLYYEEPSHSLNPDMLVALKEGVKTPLATGERIGSKWGFKEIVERRAIAVAQPDLGVVGGITEAKKVADFCNLHDVGIQMHMVSGPILSAATLHCVASFPNFVYHENLAWNISDVFINIGKHKDIAPVDGHYVVPERPGIGQELSEEAISMSDIEVIQ